MLGGGKFYRSYLTDSRIITQRDKEMSLASNLGRRHSPGR